MKYLNIVWKSILSFFNHDGPMLAGSITCFFMMSIAPFVLLVVAIFGYILGENQEFYHFLSTRIGDFFPTITFGVMEQLQKIITYRKFDLFTLSLYAYFSYQLYFSFERSLNIIFESPGKRSIFKSLLLALFFAISLMVLLFMLFGIKVSFSFIESIDTVLPEINVRRINTLLMGWIVPVVLFFITALIIYLIVPQKKIRVRHAVTGAFVTTVLIETGKYLFTYYATVKISQFGVVYGSLTMVVIFLFWIFYATCIFLFGAEIIRNLDQNFTDHLDT